MGVFCSPPQIGKGSTVPLYLNSNSVNAPAEFDTPRCQLRNVKNKRVESQYIASSLPHQETPVNNLPSIYFKGLHKYLMTKLLPIDAFTLS